MQLVREVRGLDLFRAVEFIEAWRRGRGIPGRAAEDFAEVAMRSPVGEPDAQLYSRVVELSPLGTVGRSYLRSRGIGAAVVERAGIAEIGSGHRLLQRLKADFPTDRLERAGLLGRRFDGSPKLILPGPALLFPFMEEGRLVSLQARRLRDGEPRWMGLNGQPKRCYRLLGSGRRTVWLCEGITDALTAAELGHDAVGLLGADAIPDPQTLSLLRGREVYVVGDNDNSGARFSARLLRLLSVNAIAADVIPLPPGFNDLNDWKNGCVRSD